MNYQNREKRKKNNNNGNNRRNLKENDKVNEGEKTSQQHSGISRKMSGNGTKKASLKLRKRRRRKIKHTNRHNKLMRLALDGRWMKKERKTCRCLFLDCNWENYKLLRLDFFEKGKFDLTGKTVYIKKCE